MARRGEYQVLDDSESAQVGLLQRSVSINTSGGANSNARLAAFADRGSGYYQEERDKRGEASLVETGRHAGRSRVLINEAKDLNKHTWTRDLFTSLVGLKISYLFGIICIIELSTWAFWSAVWFMYHHATGKKCMLGIDDSSMLRTVVSTVLFSVETQQTIGYGGRVPLPCTLSALILILQCLTQLVLEAVCVGLVFARLSHPKARGRSIFISESAVIARRDGALKLMFRIADARTTQVIAPKISAYLYSWGGARGGRYTAEGERITCRVEELKIQYNDGMLLLPVICEHDINYSSPLCSISHDMMKERQMEVVVVLEGTNESGGSFSVRQSYLPNEIHWGHTFVTIIQSAEPPKTRHTVSLSKFHEVEPLPGLGMMTPSECSHYCLQHEKGVVPFPSVNEDSLVISDNLVVCSRSGRLFLMARIGDTCPRNTMSVTAKAYLYQWKKRHTPEGEVLPFRMRELELRSRDLKGNPVKTSEMLLRMPQLAVHEIDDNSPIAAWINGESAMYQADLDSEIVFQVAGTKLTTGLPTLVKRTYTVAKDIKFGYHFRVMVSPPSIHGSKPTIDWRLFHHVAKNNRPSIDGSSVLSGPGSLSSRSSPGTSSAPGNQLRPPQHPPVPNPHDPAAKHPHRSAESTLNINLAGAAKPPRHMAAHEAAPMGGSHANPDNPEPSDYSPRLTPPQDAEEGQQQQHQWSRQLSSRSTDTPLSNSCGDLVKLVMMNDAAAAESHGDDPGDSHGRTGGGRGVHHGSGRSSAAHSSGQCSPGSTQGSRPPVHFAASTSGGGNSCTLSSQGGSPSGKKMLEQHWGAKRSLAKLSFNVADDDDESAAETKEDRHEMFGSTWHDDGE